MVGAARLVGAFVLVHVAAGQGRCCAEPAALDISCARTLHDLPCIICALSRCTLLVQTETLFRSSPSNRNTASCAIAPESGRTAPDCDDATKAAIVALGNTESGVAAGCPALFAAWMAETAVTELLTICTCIQGLNNYRPLLEMRCRLPNSGVEVPIAELAGLCPQGTDATLLHRLLPSMRRSKVCLATCSSRQPMQVVPGPATQSTSSGMGLRLPVGKLTRRRVW